MSDEELVIKTSVEQMFAPLQRLLDQLLGPAATEVGLTFSDSLKVWRFKRQLHLLQEVKRLIEGSGKDVKPIATRLFFPVLEAASIEDDDETQTRWAALIANEATDVGSVHPSYIEVLRQLTPDDARLLDKLCEEYERKKELNKSQYYRDRSNLGIENVPDWDSLQNLLRMGLVQADYDIPRRDSSEGRIPAELETWYVVSEFAVSFVHACRAPTHNDQK